MDEKKPSARSRTRSSAGPSKAGSPAKPPARPAARPAPRTARPADGAQLLERAARGDFPASLYLDGPDEALKAAFLSDFRAAWARHCPEAPAARVMRSGENDVDEILAVYHGISMFTPRELTLVIDVEDYARSEKRVAALAAGVARPAGASCLVLVESASESERKSLAPLRAACGTRWEAEPLGRSGLIAWVERRLAAERIEVAPGTAAALVEACEGEALATFNELGKLIAWGGVGGRVTPDDVAAILRPVVGADIPKYLEAVAAGETGVAAQRLERLIAAGANEGSVLWALGNLVGGALGGWTRWRDISATLARRKPSQLARSLDAVYRAEAAWKGGRLDVRLALEQATRDVAS